MAKFNQARTRPAVGAGPIATQPQATGTTHEGAPGYARDAKGELFLHASSNLVGEQTFYENVSDRDVRYAQLVRQVAVEDVGWMLGFLRWLRGEGNLRSASLVGAAEAVHARLAAAQTGGGEVGTGARNRQLVDAVLQRADEPGELLAYWTSRFGRAIPKPVKRGVGDAVRRLYTERELLKYDTASHGFRFADVIELTHPAPDLAKPWQGELFAHALDRRHDHAEDIPEALVMLRANAVLRSEAAEDPAVLLDADRLRYAGMTWEDALSLAGSKVDKKALWEALIPSMGIMALARNLRNFDEAGVSDEVADTVAARFADAEQVARSRMFAFRWLAAYRQAPSLRWSHALDRALTNSLAGVPELPGRTLILVDRSVSMFGAVSGRSELTFADSAAIFGTALAMRNHDRVSLVQYGNGSEEIQFRRGTSLLMVLGRFGKLGGTATAAAVRRHYSGHDRVVIVTDEQAWARSGNPGDHVPSQVPLYTFNLVGYRHGHQGDGPNRTTIGGGLTDHAFRLIPLLEAGRRGVFPWEPAGPL